MQKSSSIIFYFAIFAVVVTGHTTFAQRYFGYRVTRGGALIQITREIYRDERLWKEIAHWNDIREPYEVATGAVLLLLKPPQKEIPLENRVAEHEIPDLKPFVKWPSVARQLVAGEEKGTYWYTVNERAPSLYMVARDLYGDTTMAKKIAAWNGLPSDASLTLGQRLLIKVAPKLSVEEGDSILVQQWEKLGNVTMAARLASLGGTISGKTTTAGKVTLTSTTAASVVPGKLPEKVIPMSAPMPVAVPEAKASSQPALNESAQSLPVPPSQQAAAPVPLQSPRLPATTELKPELKPGEQKDDSYWFGDAAEIIIERVRQKLELLERSK